MTRCLFIAISGSLVACAFVVACLLATRVSRKERSEPNEFFSVIRDREKAERLAWRQLYWWLAAAGLTVVSFGGLIYLAVVLLRRRHS